MYKLICCIFVFLAENLYAQDFLNNSDYIYAEGRGLSIDEADKAALAALTNTIKVFVKTSSTYKVSDSNGKISRFYNQDVEVNSSMTLKDCKIYIDENFTNGYRVFRYLNKKEYVETRKRIVNELIKNNNVFPYNMDLNLLLGRYYYAYQILNDDLLSIFDYRNEELKKSIKTLALNKQKEIRFEETSGIFFDLNINEVPFCGKISDYTNKPYFDLKNIYISINKMTIYKFNFEYWDGERWSNAYEKSINRYNDLNYSTIFKIKCAPKFSRNKFNLKNQIKYRILFQTLDDLGNKIVIDVPDDWYYYGEVNMASPNRICDWLNYDIERHIIDRKQAFNYYESLFN